MAGWGAAMGAWGGPRAPPQMAMEAAPLGASDLSEVDLAQSAPPSTNSTLKGTDVAAREAAVARREAALAAKEKDVAAREAQLRREGKGPRKNWPICFPIVHHDIANDVPPAMRAIVRQVYFCFLALLVCLTYNFVGSCVMMGTKAQDKASSFFLAAIYLVAGAPGAMVGWYIKLYNAAVNDGALGYLGFFIMFIIHVCFCIWAAIAVPLGGERWSFTGYIAAIRAFDVAKYAAVIYLIGAVLWTLEALWSLWCLKLVYFNFRSGGKQAEAQNEMQRMALNAALQHQMGGFAGGAARK